MSRPLKVSEASEGYGDALAAFRQARRSLSRPLPRRPLRCRIGVHKWAPAIVGTRNVWSGTLIEHGYRCARCGKGGGGVTRCACGRPVVETLIEGARAKYGPYVNPQKPPAPIVCGAPPAWTSVEDALPEHYERVSIRVDGVTLIGFLGESSTRTSGVWQCGELGYDTDPIPTHWMPLPEEPESDECV